MDTDSIDRDQGQKVTLLKVFLFVIVISSHVFDGLILNIINMFLKPRWILIYENVVKEVKVKVKR